jgi:squalene-hopene/tetraprenyl-beta-curcumene cyclase
MSVTPLFMFAIPRRADAVKAVGSIADGDLALIRSRAPAAQFLIQHMEPARDGSGFLFYSQMKGRLLETALVLHILQKEGVDPDWQDRLYSYLVDNISNADVFSAIVAKAVLVSSSKDIAPEGMSSFGVNRLVGALQYAKKRKYALLSTILAEVGAVPFGMFTVNPDHFADEAVHLFSRLYVAALKIIHERWKKTGVDLTADVAFLAEAQGDNGGWEQQSLITIVALLALGSKHPSFEKGLEFLKSLTHENGSVAFCDNLNLWTTSLAAIALLKSEQIANGVFHRIADYVVARQHESGGWAFSERVTQTDTDTSAQCAQLLIQLDPDRYAEPIARAHRYFLGLQRPDGGYPTYEVAGDSEATMSANIVLVQAMSIDRRPDLREPIRNGLRFIRARQKPDGTFERSWSLCETYSIFRVNLALNGCRGLDDGLEFGEIQRKSLDYLLGYQHEDGGWGQTSTKASDALSTSYALLSLALLRRQVPADRIALAQKYLLSQQDATTGGFISVPDVVGPRPIVFNIPMLSTIFPVMALRILEQI